MTDTLTVAVMAGLGGMLGWGFADFFAKKTVDRVGDIVSLVWAHLFGTAFFIIIALSRPIFTNGSSHLPDNLSTWLGLIFFGVLQMTVYWLVYKAFSKGQLAVLNPVFASYSGIVALVSIAFLGEALTGLTAIALPLIFIGILLLNSDMESLKNKRLKVTPGLKEISVAAILAAIWTIGWDKFVSGHDFLTYALFMYLFMSLAALALAKIQRVRLLVIKGDLWKLVALIGICETIAYFSITLGFSRTSHTSVVALISGSFSLPAVILSYLFLKERLTRLQAAAVALIIFGVIMVSLT
jgi:drug/metabolite transporter (DMT)-like permease